MNKSRPNIVLLITQLLLVLSGCIYESSELPPCEGYLKINLTWDDITPPAITTYYFYNNNGDAAIVAEGTEAGFEGWLPVGTYDVVISHKGMVGASYQMLGNCENDIVLIDKQGADIPGYIGNVGNIYGTSLRRIIVPYSKVPIVKNASPKSYVRYITLVVQPNGLNDITDVEVDISGVVSSIKAHNGELSTLDGSVFRIKVPKNDVDTDFSTMMSMFGFTGINEVVATVTIPGHGNLTTIPRDITEELAAIPKEGGIIIVPLLFPNGGQIIMKATVWPWGVGGSGGGVIE